MPTIAIYSSDANLRRRLESGRDWVEREGRFELPRSREKLIEIFDDALQKLESL